jgi:hypothetical protein
MGHCLQSVAACYGVLISLPIRTGASPSRSDIIALTNLSLFFAKEKGEGAGSRPTLESFHEGGGFPQRIPQHEECQLVKIAITLNPVRVVNARYRLI